MINFTPILVLNFYFKINKVKNFQEILEKYAGKYKNIKEQLKRRDAIQKFKEAAEEIQINAQLLTLRNNTIHIFKA